MYHRSCSLRLMMALVVIIAATGLCAQTPGLIYRPASTAFGRSVLDPNGDTYAL